MMTIRKSSMLFHAGKNHKLDSASAKCNDKIMSKSFKLHYKGAPFLYKLLFAFWPKFNITVKYNGSLYVYRYVLIFGTFLFYYDCLVFDLPETRVVAYSDVSGNA